LSSLPLVLVVETEAGFVSRLPRIIEDAGFQPSLHASFQSARNELQAVGDLYAVVSNIRLGAFNGIHLAYVVKLANVATRVLLYARPHDAILALEAKHAGAFYQRAELLPYSLTPFLLSALPQADRRDVQLVDRRLAFRGGRRTTDIASPHGATT
jgi:DNA-binding NtrC family response regulator